jgi:hypothetical protein
MSEREYCVTAATPVVSFAMGAETAAAVRGANAGAKAEAEDARQAASATQNFIFLVFLNAIIFYPKRILCVSFVGSEVKLEGSARYMSYFHAYAVTRSKSEHKIACCGHASGRRLSYRVASSVVSFFARGRPKVLLY